MNLSGPQLVAVLLFLSAGLGWSVAFGLDRVQLSPDGLFVAAVTEVPAQPGAKNLVTMRLSDGLARAITGFSDSDVSHFFWANEERLIFSTDKESDETGQARHYRGSYTILREGTDGRKLYHHRARRSAAGQAGPGTPPQLLHRLPTDRKNVLIVRTDPASIYPEVFLLDVERPRSKRVVASEFQITRWLTDHAGNVRAAVAQGTDQLDGRERLLYRDEPDGNWRQVATYAVGELSLLAFYVDNRSLIVLDRIGQDSTDTRQGLYLIDANGDKVRLLVSNPDYSVGNLSGGAAGLKQTGQGHLIYYQYMAERLRTVYFDPRWSARQDLIDEALADTVNTIIDWSDDERQLLVVARDENNVGEYYLFDTTQQELRYLESPADWVDP